MQKPAPATKPAPCHTAHTRRQADRTIMQQTITRAMCRLITNRYLPARHRPPLCRDAVHQL